MKPLIKLNLLARDVANAKEIMDVTAGQVYIGVMVKDFPTLEAAVEKIIEFQAAGIPVSVGLGAGDPAQWQKVAQAAVRTKPAHVNQVFPAAGYTVAALEAVESRHTIVNALIKPSGVPGKVIVATGPLSQGYEDALSCDSAAAMLAEVGVQSVKFFPIEGDRRLDEIAAMVQAAVRHGIKTFEPTGGIGVTSLAAVLRVCAENGAERIIPHVYTSIVDKTTGLTRLSDVRELTRAMS